MSALLAGFLFGVVLLLLGLLVVAVLPRLRRPGPDIAPDLHAPSSPSSIGVGSLVLSGIATWIVFVPLGHTDARALLDTYALALSLAALLVHIITLLVALTGSTTLPVDEAEAEAQRRTKKWGALAILVYALALFSATLWPWLATR